MEKEKRRPGRPKGSGTKAAKAAAAAQEAAMEIPAAEIPAAVSEEAAAQANPQADAPTEKAPAKRRGRAPKQDKAAAAASKAQGDLKPELVLQFQGKESVVEDAIEKAKAQFVAAGHRMSTIKSLQVYLKPEEFAAYYVINQKFAGRVDLF